MRLTLSALSSLLIVSLAYSGDNWTQFRGPNGEGISDAKGIPTTWSETENIRWKTPIHDKGWSSPVVWGKQIWLTTAFADYGANPPKEKAMEKIPKPLYVDFYAICVDKDTGKIIHDIKLYREDKADFCHSFNSYATPTPVIEEGRVYVHFGSHGTIAIDTTNGKPLWTRRDLLCDHFRGPGSSPIIDDKRIYLTFDGFDQQYVCALDKKTGDTVWKTDRKIIYSNSFGDYKKAYSTPAIFEVNGKKQLVSPAAEATIAYDPESGKELWRVLHGGMNEATVPLLGHGLIYLTTGSSQNLVAVKTGGSGTLSKDEIAWKMNKGVPTRPSMLLLQDHLYMVNDNGFASCVDAKTGKQLWNERLSGSYSTSPTLIEGKMYVSNQEGTTYVVEASPTFNKLAENKLSDGCLASPAVTGNALILRTKTHLYCIGKK